ncbi:competence protein CoiA [Aerococcus christensenii]
MMYYAHTQHGELMTAFEVKDRLKRGLLKADQRKFFCPKCHQPVRYLDYPPKRPYFKHYVRQNSNLENESLWHKYYKKQLAQRLQAVGYSAEMEVPMSHKERRSDVWVDFRGKKVTLEVQSSLLSLQEVVEREADYAEEGGQVIWLLNPSPQKYQVQVNHLDRLAPFLSISPVFGLYVPFLEGDKVRLDQLTSFGKVCQRIRLTIEDYLLLKLFPPEDLIFTPSTLPPSSRLSEEACRSQKKRVLLSPNAYEKIFLSRLYQWHKSLEDLPLFLFSFADKCLWVKEDAWLVRAYSYLLAQEEVEEGMLEELLHQRPFKEDCLPLYRNFLQAGYREKKD